MVGVSWCVTLPCVPDCAEATLCAWPHRCTTPPRWSAHSPTTARYDRYTKRRLYQDVGIPFYWIVDPDEKLVEVWTPESVFPTVERQHVRWSPGDVEEDFALDLEALFKPI